jgi:predicted nucleic acid-binding Zn ribbon protein
VPDDEQPDAAADEQAGPDAVRAAFNRARADAQARGIRPGAAIPGVGGARARRRRAPADSRSGAWPDARDPQPVGVGIQRVVAEHGWGTAVAVGGVIGRWDAVVGAEVAAHCHPESFADGVLLVRADSSAWATQVRLLALSLLRRLGEELGEGTVTKVVVRGPTAPSWRRGPRVAPGSQGPRDTYG